MTLILAKRSYDLCLKKVVGSLLFSYSKKKFETAYTINDEGSARL